MADLVAGWGFPANARKSHYFEEGCEIALCGRWLFLGRREPDTGSPSRDDCAQCRRRLEENPPIAAPVTLWMSTPRGREFTVHQAANDWLSVNFADGTPGIVSPQGVRCTEQGWSQVLAGADEVFARQWRWDAGVVRATSPQRRSARSRGRSESAVDVTKAPRRAPAPE